ncbi:hypothetical protein PHB09_085 [Pseudomonas phage PHB09]|uniref:Uncharacterized protein n=1 Tax=Pseudomonas phage PHB09 TaxID=2867265 RepID=A0AAE8XCV2_9CAUD|nr:hypothetical protein QGX10_gp085 [Pseudomonas phage PHB09]UAV84581.1 hypothetical protein PHB09_085 [Pseudomonas phage PHB09]
MIAIGTKVRVITTGEEGYHFFDKGQIVTRIKDPAHGYEDEDFQTFQNENGQLQWLEESDYELL